MFETLAKYQEKVDEIKWGLEESQVDQAIWKKLAANNSRVETPKPNEFSSKRDTKELDNYIWNIK